MKLVLFALMALTAPGYQSALSVGRVKYDGGGDWYANPSSIPNLVEAIREDTGLPVEPRERVVSLLGPELWETPFLHLTGHGNISFTDEEVANLRRYLENGGFLHADDNYGLDESFRREMERIFPDRPLVEVPLDHPIYSIVHSFPDGLPKVHEHDGNPPRGFGIFIGDRLAVFYSYESDLGDGWEDPDVHDDPEPVRRAALRMGVNLFVYALTAS